MSEERPLILFTNDDGIDSPGLWTVVHALADLGDRLIVAPREQQSGTGRSLPTTSEGRIYPRETHTGDTYVSYAVDGTPAQAVQHGVLELAGQRPVLVVSGINYGDNLGNSVTVSGTVGAALEAASLGIPALAVSQRTRHDQHLSHSDEVDFSAAAYFARLFAEWLIFKPRPDDVDLLKVDVPLNATPETEWRITRLSRRRVYWPTRPENRANLNDIGRLGYAYNTDPGKAEPDSDVYAVLHDGVVSVTPISLNMTSRTDMYRLRRLITGEWEYGR
jgi:5'-nucleotidase